MPTTRFPMRLSQTQLNLLETCPRKFQHTYLEQLGAPATPEQQEKLAWGSRFHQVMQQRELGLPVKSLVRQYPQILEWVTALDKAAPEIFSPVAEDADPTAADPTAAPTGKSFRQAEHWRTLHFQDYTFAAVYDLLIADEKSAAILDWKTYPRPQDRKWVAQNWQTRLYPFVLAETSNYLPETISMTYWFVESKGEPNEPESLIFAYDEGQHQKTKEDLTRLLSGLTDWLDRYQKDIEPFPQVSLAAGRCTGCQFAIRCQRDRSLIESTAHAEQLSDLATIEEVVL